MRNVGALQNFLVSKGFSNIKVKILWAKEVVLEFLNREEMLAFLQKGGNVLVQKFEWIIEAPNMASPTRHFIWVNLRNVPLIAWNVEFFREVAGIFDSLVR